MYRYRYRNEQARTAHACAGRLHPCPTYVYRANCHVPTRPYTDRPGPLSPMRTSGPTRTVPQTQRFGKG